MTPPIMVSKNIPQINGPSEFNGVNISTFLAGAYLVMSHQNRFNAVPVNGVCDVHDTD